MLGKIKESAAYIAKITGIHPACGIILGSGLGAFESEITISKKIPFSSIPNFPDTGIGGHSGILLMGTLGKVPVIVMQGRIHCYEGYSPREVTFPVRVMKELGIRSLLLTNAAGGLNPEFEIGNIMLVTDHINLMSNPLIGPNLDELGPRFPDMSDAYDSSMIMKALSIAQKENIKLRTGVYIAVTGPSYETPAEYRYLRSIGGDAVGMSTVPEVIVARHMGISCCAFSVITDLGVPGKVKFLTHEMVRKAAESAEPVLARILRKLVSG